MTEEPCFIGDSDVVLPDVDQALSVAIAGLDGLLDAIKHNVENGVPLPVAKRLLYAHPAALKAREMGTVIFERLYSSWQTADEIDYDTPF